MHVTEVVLALDVVLVVFDKLVLIRKLENDCEETEELDDDFIVAFPAETLDLFDMILEDRRLSPRMVAVKFRNVVDLDVVLDGFCESAWSVRVVGTEIV